MNEVYESLPFERFMSIDCPYSKMLDENAFLTSVPFGFRLPGRGYITIMMDNRMDVYVLSYAIYPELVVFYWDTIIMPGSFLESRDMNCVWHTPFR